MKIFSILSMSVFLLFHGFSAFAQGNGQNGQKDLQKEIYEALKGKSEPYEQELENGRINWTEQFIEVEGMSVMDTQRFRNPAQARAMALRGAVVDGQRNLLEIVKGVHIESETKVVDFMAVSDEVTTKVSGVIRGAQRVGDPREEFGAIVVTMRVSLYANGLGDAMYDEVKKKRDELKKKQASESAEADDETTKDTESKRMAKADSPMQQASGDAEALKVFNLVGDGNIDPSLFPVLTDEQQNILFDLMELYNSEDGSFPNILKTSRKTLEQLGFDQAVEVIDIIQKAPGEFGLKNEEDKGWFTWDNIRRVAGRLGRFLLMLF